MRDVTGIPTGFFTGAAVGYVGSYIGSYVAPASAAAAGGALGALGVMGACAIGGAVTFFGGSYLVGATLERATDSWKSGDYGLSSVFFALSAAEIGGLAFLAAGIGATFLNIAVQPVFLCALCGAGPMLVPILIAAAFAGLLALGNLACSSDNVLSL
ncbi:MAG: hypothetical protein GW760_06780 [Legionella sp.]|jgi:hypothetical protein|nr:hypothetical protein [Legionella sp.]